MNQGIPFPTISPVLFEIGPFAVHWYGIAYIVGLLGGWLYLRWLLRQPLWQYKGFAQPQADDLLLWMTLGVIVGGRIGYVLFYNLEFFLLMPQEIFAVWHGGMAFHGGLLGAFAVAVWFARSRGLPALALCDILVCIAPIGLFFGRIANFINAELWGRVTTMPWGVVFPSYANAGDLPRHPSQLYEAGLEGILLFAILNYALLKRNALATRGLLSAIFLVGYGSVRIFVEQFRAPDTQLGFLGGATMGVWLSLPMLGFGFWLLRKSMLASRPRL